MGGKSLVEVYSNQCTGGHNALAYGHGASAAAGQRHHPSSSGHAQPQRRNLGLLRLPVRKFGGKMHA